MTQNIEQRTLAATNTMEGAAKTVDEIAHQDKDVPTPVGSRKSFPKIAREADDGFRNQRQNHEQEFQNRWAISQQAQEWTPNTLVSDSLQRYSVGVVGSENYKEYLPAPEKLPFTTSLSIAEDLLQDRWLENGVASKSWTEKYIGDIDGVPWPIYDPTQPNKNVSKKGQVYIYQQMDGDGAKLGPAIRVFDPVGGNVMGAAPDANFLFASSGVFVSLEFFGCKSGEICTQKILQANAYCYLQNKVLVIPEGRFLYDDDLEFTCNVKGRGYELSKLIKVAPATVTIKSTNFYGVDVSAEGRIPLDTTDGVIASLNQNDGMIQCRTQYHGGDGFIWLNGNISNVRVKTRYNGKRGYVAATNPVGNNNCIEMFIETTRNDGAGFEIEGSANLSEMANCLRGHIIAQNNGLVTEDPDQQWDVILAGYDHSKLTIYAEYGKGSVWFKDTLKSSEIFISSGSFLTMKDDQQGNNNVISYTYGARGDRRLKEVRTERLSIKKQSMKGHLDLEQTDNLEYKLDAIGSDSVQTLIIGPKLNVENEQGGRLAFQIFKQGTLNFGSIPAGSTVERQLSIGLPVLPFSISTAMPRFQLPAGVVFDWYVLDENTSDVHIRCTNVTQAAITVPEGGWRVEAFSDDDVVLTEPVA